MKMVLQISLVSVALAGSAAADLIEKDVSRLKLRPQVYARGDMVTLADVLDFAQADPRLLAEIGDRPALADLVAPTQTEITHDQIVYRLEELGINRSTFYEWYRNYLERGFEGLKPKVPDRKSFWTKIPKPS